MDQPIYARGGADEDRKRRSTVEVLDVRAGRWTAAAAMPTARGSLAAAVVAHLAAALGAVSTALDAV